MPRGTKSKVQRAATRSVERALREERLALAAIAKCFVLETENPMRLLTRLEALARNAEANPRVKLSVRRTLLDATALVKTAIERELRQPQTLMEPHVGHVSANAVDKLVAAGDAEQQLALGQADNGIADVEAVQKERLTTISTVHGALVRVLREGPATDDEIYLRYSQLQDVPTQSAEALVHRRHELAALGRIRTTKRNGDSAWDLVENA